MFIMFDLKRTILTLTSRGQLLLNEYVEHKLAIIEATVLGFKAPYIFKTYKLIKFESVTPTLQMLDLVVIYNPKVFIYSSGTLLKVSLNYIFKMGLFRKFFIFSERRQIANFFFDRVSYNNFT